MAQRIFITAVTLILLGIFTMTHALDDGFHDANIMDTNITEIAQFAVKEVNKLQDYKSAKMKLVMTEKAEVQIINGKNYKLMLLIGICGPKNTTRPCKMKRDGFRCDVIVHDEKPDNGEGDGKHLRKYNCEKAQIPPLNQNISPRMLNVTQDAE